MGVASVMCGFSVINGDFACHNSYLETTSPPATQWGFPGFVMSDYGALHSTQGAVQGTDQEQPFNTYYGAPLQTAVQNGTIPKSVLNTMVQRVLTEMFRFKLFSQPRTGTTDGHRHHAPRTSRWPRPSPRPGPRCSRTTAGLPLPAWRTPARSP